MYPTRGTLGLHLENGIQRKKFRKGCPAPLPTHTVTVLTALGRVNALPFAYAIVLPSRVKGQQSRAWKYLGYRLTKGEYLWDVDGRM